MSGGASAPPPNLPGLDPHWSRLVEVMAADGRTHTWHLLDSWASRPPVAGAAPELTLLCVHGNPTWSYLWRRLLATAPPWWRVIAPDQLGMGYSDRPAGPRRLTERVVDLTALTDELGVTGPVVTVAHDWGGPISLGWAAEHRGQLRGVVLTNTAVHQPAGATGPAVIRLANLPGVRTIACTRTPAFVRGTTALSRPALPTATRAAFAAPYTGAQRRRAVADFVADIPFTPTHPSYPGLEQIAASTRTLDVPALLVWGTRDPVFGQAHLDDLLERLPQAQVHRYEQASHLVTEDAPEYATAVTQWIQDGPAAGEQQAVTSAPPSPSRRPALWQRLHDRAGDPTTAVVEVGGRQVSWQLLTGRVRELAAGLAAIGVLPGDRVALLVPPSIDLTAAVYALWRAGAVIVLADKGLGLVGMGRALRGARVDHVIGSAQGLVAARAMRLPGTRIRVGTTSWPGLGATFTLADVARRGRGAPPPAEPAAGDECAVVFTSGATGPAKGVVYRHRQVAAQLAMISDTYGLGAGDRLVAAFAPFALYGPGLGIASAVPDMDVTSPGTLTADALADAVDAVDATVVFASPAALRNVVATAADLSPRQRATLGRVRLLMSAGAPVSVALLRALRTVLPGAEAHTPYGMTEALPVTDVTLVEIEVAGAGHGVCVGAPLSGVEVAVSPLSATGAADGGLTGDADVTGEICVRGEHVKDRYDALWATERASSRTAGWHRSGDVGHLDRDGRLWVEGRLQHVLSTADGPATPVGIEQRVEALDAVRAAAAVGVGPLGTQQVVIVVVPAGGRPVTASALAPAPLADAVRAVAGVDVAAVLSMSRLPVDIRHASKVDRGSVAGWATRILAGS